MNSYVGAALIQSGERAFNAKTRATAASRPVMRARAQADA